MKKKTSSLTLLTLLGLFLSTTVLAEFVAPTEAQIDQALANPDLLATLLEEADGDQAADIIKQLIDRIVASEKLNPIQKQYNISYFVAKAVQLMGNERGAYAAALIGKDLGDNRLIVLAALAVGGAGSDAYLSDLVALLEENEAEIAAVRNPQSALNKDVYNRLLASLNLARSLPPTAGRPPVAVPYQGQRPN